MQGWFYYFVKIINVDAIKRDRPRAPLYLYIVCFSRCVKLEIGSL